MSGTCTTRPISDVENFPLFKGDVSVDSLYTVTKSPPPNSVVFAITMSPATILTIDTYETVHFFRVKTLKAFTASIPSTIIFDTAQQSVTIIVAMIGNFLSLNINPTRQNIDSTAHAIAKTCLPICSVDNLRVSISSPKFHDVILLKMTPNTTPQIKLSNARNQNPP